jgi:hypothetical protein
VAPWNGDADAHLAGTGIVFLFGQRRTVERFFEALLVTPTSLPALFAGQTGYAFAWALARVALLMIAGAFLGVDVHWSRLPECPCHPRAGRRGGMRASV